MSAERDVNLIVSNYPAAYSGPPVFFEAPITPEPGSGVITLVVQVDITSNEIYLLVGNGPEHEVFDASMAGLFRQLADVFEDTSSAEE